ncbi:MAG: Ada metal-binding domain-containing protein [Saonia sp.]
MIKHTDLSPIELRQKIKNKRITLGGNSILKIYGTLHCRSGKRMKTKNRIFFVNEVDARNEGYRPCGHCMRAAFKLWKEEFD